MWYIPVQTPEEYLVTICETNGGTIYFKLGHYNFFKINTCSRDEITKRFSLEDLRSFFIIQSVSSYFKEAIPLFNYKDQILL
jgi:hypothetical protein